MAVLSGVVGVAFPREIGLGGWDLGREVGYGVKRELVRGWSWLEVLRCIAPYLAQDCYSD